jgi:hypothetical protein
MLSRHVKPKEARVLQLGGTTRDLFYYPNGTVQVSVVEEDIKAGLWEQAGISAGVPVRPINATSTAALSSSAGAAFDSVVAFDQLGDGYIDYKTYFTNIWRVLKPGGTFIFIQRISESPLAGLVRLGGPPAAGTEVADTIAAAVPWDFFQYDIASAALDPHAVGVAIKPLQATSSDDFSVDNAAFEQVMKVKQGKSKKKSGGPQQKGFGS